MRTFTSVVLGVLIRGPALLTRPDQLAAGRVALGSSLLPTGLLLDPLVPVPLLLVWSVGLSSVQFIYFCPYLSLNQSPPGIWLLIRLCTLVTLFVLYCTIFTSFVRYL